MGKLKLSENITRAIGNAGLKFKKHSPEILIGVGIVGVVTSTVLACKASTKLEALLSDTKYKVETIHKYMDNPETLPEPYTKEDGKKDLAIVYTQTGLNLAKMYGPALTVGALSITCILAGANMFHKRNAALAAAYTALDTSFKDYRKRVVDRLGADLDKEIKYNIQTQEVEEKVVDEKGKEKTVKKKVDVMDPTTTSPYAVFFDVGCANWTKDPEQNKWFLVQQQNWANDKLKAQGHLFLNEVYDMIDVPRTKAGNNVGWLYKPEDPTRDSHVDFGIFDINRPANRDFVNGYERTILLDFNVDGPIIDLI